jgi:transcriptional regulator with XRE-family HTH domain
MRDTDPGRTIRQARHALNWSQTTLATAVGVTQAQISRLELNLVPQCLDVLVNALAERVQESLAAGQVDARAAEALSAIQSLEMAQAVAA